MTTSFSSAIRKFVTLALVAAFVGIVPSLSAAVIALNNPVSNSLTPTALYWTYDSETAGSVADGSGNGYDGVLTQGFNSPNSVNTPTLATGVNLPGTSGFGNAVSVIGKSSTPNYSTNQNPSVRYVPGSTAAYSMASGASFTGGTWLNVNTSQSVQPAGSLNLYVMNSGLAYAASSHWAFTLFRSSSLQWNIVFSVGNGSTNSLGFLPIADLWDDTWHHLGFSFNGVNNQVNFWVDGGNVGSATLLHGIGAPANATERTFRVGERVQSNFQELSYAGRFDDTFVTSGIHTFAAVPEPSSTALMMGVAVLLAASFRRWSKSRSG